MELIKAVLCPQCNRDFASLTMECGHSYCKKCVDRHLSFGIMRCSICTRGCAFSIRSLCPNYALRALTAHSVPPPPAHSATGAITLGIADRQPVERHIMSYPAQGLALKLVLYPIHVSDGGMASLSVQLGSLGGDRVDAGEYPEVRIKVAVTNRESRRTVRIDERYSFPAGPREGLFIPIGPRANMFNPSTGFVGDDGQVSFEYSVEAAGPEPALEALLRETVGAGLPIPETELQTQLAELGADPAPIEAAVSSLASAVGSTPIAMVATSSGMVDLGDWVGQQAWLQTAALSGDLAPALDDVALLVGDHIRPRPDPLTGSGLYRSIHLGVHPPRATPDPTPTHPTLPPTPAPPLETEVTIHPHPPAPAPDSDVLLEALLRRALSRTVDAREALVGKAREALHHRRGLEDRVRAVKRVAGMVAQPVPVVPEPDEDGDIWYDANEE